MTSVYNVIKFQYIVAFGTTKDKNKAEEERRLQDLDISIEAIVPSRKDSKVIPSLKDGKIIPHFPDPPLPDFTKDFSKDNDSDSKAS